ncbi:MAG: hypothetical protein VX871_00135, partial [Pseudomonadota bacterium]|nr:hypothetical protein [Pseudomonadota bacterium]
AVLAFVRPLYLLYPLMVATLVMFTDYGIRDRLKSALLICALSVSLTAAWQGALALNNGRYPVEASFHGLASNLYLRAVRVEAVGGYRVPAETKERKTMPPAEFLQLAAGHPFEMARTFVSDGINLAANTGASMVYGRFFGLFSLAERNDAEVFKWRDVRDNQGFGAMLTMLWETSPLGFIINLAAGALWVLIVVCAAWGALRLAGHVALPVGLRLLLLLTPAYALAFSFISGSVRWDHRSPAEFAISVFFAIGVLSLAGQVIHSRARQPARSRSEAALTSGHALE